jgi:lipoate-protein ligase A
VKSKLVTAFESEFNMELHDGELSLTEHVRYQRALSEIDSPDWVNLLRQPVVGAPLCAGQQIISGGLLTADVIYDRSAQRIKQVWFRGDVDNSPRRVIADLEAALRGTLIRSRRSHD